MPWTSGARGITARAASRPPSKPRPITLREAELRTLEYLRRFTNKGQSPLCGSSVSHDRRFIDKYMPDLSAWLHYRTVDVSTVKELVKRWYADVTLPSKKNSHRALDDIRESVEELRSYRSQAFRAPSDDPSRLPPSGAAGYTRPWATKSRLRPPSQA